ncbi:hypothetical protein ACOME3_008974 [Neoechinorhynchus agilis]
MASSAMILKNLLGLIDKRNSLTSIYDEMIEDYGRLVDAINLTRSNSAFANNRERDRLRLIELQHEVIFLHKRIDAATEQAQRLSEANAELNGKLSDFEVKEVQWKKENNRLLLIISERETVISEKDRVIQLQADEYTTLRLDANVTKSKYSSLKKDYEELVDRYTSGQAEIADKLNLQLDEYERQTLSF